MSDTIVYCPAGHPMVRRHRQSDGVALRGKDRQAKRQTRGQGQEDRLRRFPV